MRPLVTAIAASAMLLAGIGFAQHNSEQDVWVRVEAPEAAEPVAERMGRLGSRMYRAQEHMHGAVTEATGVEVEHYYVWVCVGDGCVPVDPFTVNR